MKSQKRAKEVLKRIRLDDSRMWAKHLYYPEKQKKSLITIHHTVGYSALSSLQYLETRAQRAARAGKGLVGVPFYVARDGVVLQAFPSSAWAYSLGLNLRKSIKDEVEKRNISIELANLGPLVKRSGKFYDVYGKVVSKDKVYDNKRPWRGYRYWEDFTAAQIKSLSLLLQYLTLYYGIEPVFNMPFFPEKPVQGKAALTGIVSHCHFRDAKSKQDVSVAFNPWLGEIREELEVVHEL